MRMLLRALSAETLKLKRTLALWVVVGAPMVVILLTVLVLLNPPRGSTLVDMLKGMNQGSISVWAVFMLPLFIVLETALVSAIDHNSKSWKHLYAMPIPRWAIYTAKLFAGLALTAASTLVLWLGLVSTGLIMHAIWPGFYIINGSLWFDTLRPLAIIYLAALLILAFHTWSSNQWPSFALSIGIGISGVFFALFASSAKLAKFYPWLLPINTRDPALQSLALILGITGGIIISIVGCWEVTRRDVL